MWLRNAYSFYATRYLDFNSLIYDLNVVSNSSAFFHPPIIDDRNVKNCIIYSDCLICHCQDVLVCITVIPSSKLPVAGSLVLVRWIAEIQQHMLLIGLEERFENGCYGLSYLGVYS